MSNVSNEVPVERGAEVARDSLPREAVRKLLLAHAKEILRQFPDSRWSGSDLITNLQTFCELTLPYQDDESSEGNPAAVKEAERVLRTSKLLSGFGGISHASVAELFPSYAEGVRLADQAAHAAVGFERENASYPNYASADYYLAVADAYIEAGLDADAVDLLKRAERAAVDVFNEGNRRHSNTSLMYASRIVACARVWKRLNAVEGVNHCYEVVDRCHEATSEPEYRTGVVGPNFERLSLSLDAATIAGLAGDLERARTLLEDAIQEAQTMPEVESGDYILARVVEVSMELGLSAVAGGALDSLEKYMEPVDVSKRLRCIKRVAPFYKQLNRGSDLLIRLDGIARLVAKDAPGLAAELAVLFSDAGDRQSAERMLNEATSSARTAIGRSRYAWEAGRDRSGSTEARKVFDAVTQGYATALAAARIGDSNAAEALIAAADKGTEGVYGDFSDWDRLPFMKADIYKACGEYQKALQSLERIRSSGLKADALRAFAKDVLKQGVYGIEFAQMAERFFEETFSEPSIEILATIAKAKIRQRV